MPSNLPSLYAIEEGLQAFTDTEEGGVPEELKEEFAVELAAAKADAVAKRDNVIQFLRHLEMQADAAKAEKDRLAALEKHYRTGLKNFKEYVVNVIENHVEEPKRGPRKLEGSVGVLSLRKLPDVVVIEDAEAVPFTYADVSVTFGGMALNEIIQALNDAGRGDLADILTEHRTVSPRKSDIKKALQADVDVPGADLQFGKNGLTIK